MQMRLAVDMVRLVSHPVEVRSVGEVGNLRSLANVCKADHGFWKDQPLAIAEALSLGRRAKERNDFLGHVRLVKLRLGHGSSPLSLRPRIAQRWPKMISEKSLFR